MKIRRTNIVLLYILCECLNKMVENKIKVLPQKNVDSS